MTATGQNASRGDDTTDRRLTRQARKETLQSLPTRRRSVALIARIAGIPSTASSAWGDELLGYATRERHLEGLTLTAQTLLIERDFMWRMAGLSALTLQAAGLGAGALLVLTDQTRAAILVMAAANLCLLVQTVAERVDMRWHRTVFDTFPARLGVLAKGGVVNLPAAVFATDDHRHGDDDLSRVYTDWERRHLPDPSVRETFYALAPEYGGTVGELLETSRGLNLDPS